jgi:hypothetical protein
VKGVRKHRLSRYGRQRRASVLTAAALALGTAACGSVAAAPVRPAGSGVISPSMATSTETPAGSWAVVPMGTLDDPLNTFWQLFFRPSGAAGWSDEASSLAVATNGGLSLATFGRGSLAVAIRPANRLDYSPLLVTADSGRAWSPAPPVGGVAKVPDALAVGARSRGLVLTTGTTGNDVLESDNGLTGWKEVTSTGTLQSSAAGRACGLASITAVGVVATNVLVGGDCRRAGVAGIFAETPDGWRLVRPALPAALRHEPVDVLALQPNRGGVCALLATAGNEGTSLVAACTGEDENWTVSPILDLGSGHVLSVGSDDGSGLFVLAARAASESIDVLSEPSATWSSLPNPPAGTQTLVFGVAGKVDALTVSNATFTDSALSSASGHWTKVQVIDVPIEYGSSG